MFGDNFYFIGGAVVGGVIGIYLFSVLFRYALLGRSGTKSKQMWVVLLTGIVAIGFSAFGDGTDGFLNRITNTPNMVQVISYSLSALLVGFLVWWRVDETLAPPEIPTKSGIVGRAIALVFVVPMILIGLGNIGGSIYSLAVYGPLQGSGLGVSRAEMRQNMLKGDMAPFWRVVDERAPNEMEYIIDRLFAREDEMRDHEEFVRAFNQELANFRVGLSTYGPAMTDPQRKELLEAQVEFVRRFEDRPALCTEVLVNGGQFLSQAELLSEKDAFDTLSVVMLENLLDAKQSASAGATLPKPTTDEDYGRLVLELIADGLTESELQALAAEDATRPDYCSAMIRFLDGVIAMEGASGEAVRFETSQQMLVGVAQQ